MNATLHLSRSASAIAAACLLFVYATEAVGQVDATTSLKGKSNEELLRIMIGGNNADRIEYESKIRTHLPDHFWTMPPKEAARALIEANSDAKTKQKFRFVLDATDGGHPPSKGEVGLRWHCSHCYLAEQGLTVLRYAGAESKLVYSVVKVFDLHEDVKPALIERAVNQIKTVPLLEEEARRLYEVIWWLGRTKASPATEAKDSNTAEVERVFSTGDGDATFWVSSQQPRTQVRLPAFTLNEQLGNGFDHDTRASCAEFLLREALDKHGVDLRQTTATVGRDVSSYPEWKFVFEENPPDPRAVEETQRWVSRMLELLRNPKNLSRSGIIDKLVPEAEPLRYSDPRIDAALFRLVDRGFGGANLKGQDDWSRFSEAGQAAEALAARDRAEVIPQLMKVLHTETKEKRDWKKQALQAAVTLAAQHPEFRGELLAYMKKQFVDPAKPRFVSFEVIWRADMRELATELEKLATSSSDEIVSIRESAEQGSGSLFSRSARHSYCLAGAGQPN